MLLNIIHLILPYWCCFGNDWKWQIYHNSPVMYSRLRLCNVISYKLLNIVSRKIKQTSETGKVLIFYNSIRRIYKCVLLFIMLETWYETTLQQINTHTGVIVACLTLHHCTFTHVHYKYNRLVIKVNKVKVCLVVCYERTCVWCGCRCRGSVRVVRQLLVLVPTLGAEIRSSVRSTP